MKYDKSELNPFNQMEQLKNAKGFREPGEVSESENIGSVKNVVSSNIQKRNNKRRTKQSSFYIRNREQLEKLHSVKKCSYAQLVNDGLDLLAKTIL